MEGSRPPVRVVNPIRIRCCAKRRKMWFYFLKTNDHTSLTHINDRICDIINERKSLQIIQRSDHRNFVYKSLLSAFSLSLFWDETFASNWISDIAIIVLWPSGERFGQSWKDYRQKPSFSLTYTPLSDARWKKTMFKMSADSLGVVK